jgi:DNA (cytosine-5)-methyltransferase 1
MTETPAWPDGRSPVAIDLFAGAGGMTLGLKQAGFHVVAAVECDPLACETYEANHPEVRMWRDDIRNVPPQVMRLALGLRPGELDLLAGCPPCQGFSSVRTRNGGSVPDPRNDLIDDFAAYVAEFRPEAVMLENVPGLGKDPRFAAFLDRMAALGYQGGYRVLDAARYGVPQRRRRLIYLAGRAGTVPFAAGVDSTVTVRDTIGCLPPAGSSGDALHDLPEQRSPRVQALIALIPHDGGSRASLPPEYALACHRRCDGFKDVYGRMAWDRVAPTITGGCVNPSKGRFLHPEEPRTITLREAALLQGFPRDYVFSLRRGKFAAAALIGNALPPEFVRRHAQEVYAYVQAAAEKGASSGAVAATSLPRP